MGSAYHADPNYFVSRLSTGWVLPRYYWPGTTRPGAIRYPARMGVVLSEGEPSQRSSILLTNQSDALIRSGLEVRSTPSSSGVTIQ